MNLSHRKGTKNTAEREKETIEWKFSAATQGYRMDGIDVSHLYKFTVRSHRELLIKLEETKLGNVTHVTA
jgi:hypothetical protein